MDNREISIISEGKSDFDLAIRLAMSGRKVTGWSLSKNVLILHTSMSDGKMNPLPYDMNVDEVINFTWGWFEKSNPQEEEPDHDGDNEKGFHIKSVSHKIAFTIEPIWAWYGK